jgi:hypothetical protein
MSIIINQSSIANHQFIVFVSSPLEAKIKNVRASTVTLLALIIIIIIINQHQPSSVTSRSLVINIIGDRLDQSSSIIINHRNPHQSIINHQCPLVFV